MVGSKVEADGHSGTAAKKMLYAVSEPTVPKVTGDHAEGLRRGLLTWMNGPRY